MDLATVYSTSADGVVTIVLNRPHVLNCADLQTVADLHAALDDVAARSDVRVVVVRGAGRAFSTGIDLTALAEGRIAQGFFRDWEVALRKIEALEAIVVAAIHSHCIGGGLQLALACDLRVARSDSRFGVTAVAEGIIPGMGMWRLARYAGLGRARQLALAADVIDAATALQWGLADYVVDAEAFESRVTELVGRLQTMAWTSTRLTKKLVNLAFDTTHEDFLDVFCEYQNQATMSDEHQRARAAHLERRARVGQR